MKEYKIKFKRKSYYANMYDNDVESFTIIEAKNGEDACDKFYEKFKDIKGKGAVTYTIIDISVL